MRTICQLGASSASASDEIGRQLLFDACSGQRHGQTAYPIPIVDDVALLSQQTTLAATGFSCWTKAVLNSSTTVTLTRSGLRMTARVSSAAYALVDIPDSRSQSVGEDFGVLLHGCLHPNPRSRCPTLLTTW